jgi:hypothetical protein
MSKITIYNGNTATIKCSVYNPDGTNAVLSGYSALLTLKQNKEDLIALFTSVGTISDNEITFSTTEINNTLTQGVYYYEVTIESGLSKLTVAQDRYVIKESLFDWTPLIFTLESTGDGSKLCTLSLEASETTVMTLSGTAKFYTDKAGTTGESSTATITVGALRTFYVKVSSGTATLIVKNVITKWGRADQSSDPPESGWFSAFPIPADHINYPVISIDVSLLTHLTSLNLYGPNNSFGDISNLTELTYIEIGGSTALLGYCNITGSIDKLTKLKVLDHGWADGTALTGGNNIDYPDLEVIWCDTSAINIDLSRCPKLQFYECGGTNTNHGSIEGLTDLWSFFPHGQETVSGSLAGFTQLYTVRIDATTTTITIPAVANSIGLYRLRTSGIVLSTANVNQILADLWANRAFHPTWVREIYLNNAGNGAPTGQGITDMLALRALGWTIVTI